MNGLALFAETPRAGVFGHRFMVPTNLAVSEPELAKFFAAADREVSLGENFISIGRSVPQHNGVGAVREGREVIFLVGIDVPRLSRQAYSQILMMLRDCTDKFEKLVLSEIDWGSMSQSEVIVPRQEMQEWLNDLRSVCLPVTAWRDGPRPLRETVAGWLQPSETPIRKITLLTSVSVSTLFALGIAVGACLDQLYLRGRDMTQPDKPTTNEVAVAHTVKPNEVYKSVPSDAPINPVAGSANLFVSIDDLLKLKNADRVGNVDTLVDILTSQPSKDSISAQDCKALINFSSGLEELNRHEDCLRIVEQIVRLKDASSLDSSIVARLDDLSRKAREECESIDQRDRSLYESVRDPESVRNSTFEQQRDAALRYLERGSQQPMSGPVQRWINWANTPIEATISKIEAPNEGSLTLRFSANGRETGLLVKSPDGISGSSPLQIVLDHIGITRQNLSASIKVTVEFEKTSLIGTTTRMEGEFQLGRPRAGDIQVSLKSAVPLQKVSTLTIQLPLVEPPELPEWSKGAP